MFNLGDKVRYTVDADRYPDFIVPNGSTGIVVYVDDDRIEVRIEQVVKGSEQWDNCIHYYDDEKYYGKGNGNLNPHEKLMADVERI